MRSSFEWPQHRMRQAPGSHNARGPLRDDVGAGNEAERITAQVRRPDQLLGDSARRYGHINGLYEPERSCYLL